MKKTNGITLIVLVITIIILLILAGVSLNLVSGGDGILSKAEIAVAQNKKSRDQEILELAYSSAKLETALNNNSMTVDSVYNELNSMGISVNVYKQNDKCSEIIFNESGNSFLMNLETEQIEYSGISSNISKESSGINEAVVSIGSNYYENFAEAISDIKSDTQVEVKIYSDITENFHIGENNTQNIILNLNGKTLTGRIWVNKNGILTLTGNGKIENSQSHVLYNEGTINIENGQYIGSKDGLMAVTNKGILNLNGGKIENIGTFHVVYNYGTLNVNGGALYANSTTAGITNKETGIINFYNGYFEQTGSGNNIWSIGKINLYGGKIYGVNCNNTITNSAGSDNIGEFNSYDNITVIGNVGSAFYNEGNANLNGGNFISYNTDSKGTVYCEKNGILNINGAIIHNKNNGGYALKCSAEVNFLDGILQTGSEEYNGYNNEVSKAVYSRTINTIEKEGYVAKKVPMKKGEEYIGWAYGYWSEDVNEFQYIDKK